MDTLASMSPTPAIMELTTTGPIRATIFSLRPIKEGISRKTAPQKTMLSRSRISRPMLPARAMVSA